MKKGRTGKDFRKFTSVNTHKRRDKEKRRAELLRALESINVSHEGCTIRDSFDKGISGRVRSERDGRGGNAKCVLGIFTGTRSGFGFVTPDGNAGDRDIFIPEGKCSGAIDGDYVE